MFDKILIANRGEIACRVARTARRLGVRTAAVYSDADAASMHVDACDEAYRIGPPPARDSYLRGDAIIAAALSAGAQAIHPGYGFLSENADFAEAIGAAGLIFIGPPPDAIRAMGSKSQSKILMGQAGVPLVPGYHGADQSDRVLAVEADRIGYPVLIKASAGGGGKGMRVAEDRAAFAGALAAARREALSSFGDDAMLIERYLTKPRHIEIQIFADMFGNCVHLFERDCSVQRRHQKVLEEAPAPGISPERRDAMGATAVAAAKAIGYVGAGTVEFIVDGGGDGEGTFHFMEMNTRLQVEHPVTEMITGVDLVEWQLRVAAGDALPLSQAALQIGGHAIEARIYAEDPDHGFLPSIGHVAHLAVPTPSANVRVDTGVRGGDNISQYYDPMIAKLIAWGQDRGEALRRLDAALRDYQVVGVKTNIAFLQRLIGHDAFAHAHLDTGLIARHHDALFPPDPGPSTHELALVALNDWRVLAEARALAAARSNDPYSPWNDIGGWTLNGGDRPIRFSYAGVRAAHEVALVAVGDELSIDVDGAHVTARRSQTSDALSVQSDGRRSTGDVIREGSERYVFCDGRMRRLVAADATTNVESDQPQEGPLTAPMSGTIIDVLVKIGDVVARDAPLMILEAMKMEHTISAIEAGTVKAVHFGKGDQVGEGIALIEIDANVPAR
jgi:3-methylcrotonyl-CoA carboxylase alpha subunit